MGRLVLGSFQLMVEYVSIATYLVPCMYLCTYRLVHEFLLNIKTCIKAQKCICIYVCIARNMAQWDEIKIKGGFISESFFTSAQISKQGAWASFLWVQSASGSDFAPFSLSFEPK